MLRFGSVTHISGLDPGLVPRIQGRLGHARKTRIMLASIQDAATLRLVHSSPSCTPSAQGPQRRIEDPCSAHRTPKAAGVSTAPC